MRTFCARLGSRIVFLAVTVAVFQCDHVRGDISSPSTDEGFGSGDDDIDTNERGDTTSVFNPDSPEEPRSVALSPLLETASIEASFGRIAFVDFTYSEYASTPNDMAILADTASQFANTNPAMVLFHAADLWGDLHLEILLLSDSDFVAEAVSVEQAYGQRSSWDFVALVRSGVSAEPIDLDEGDDGREYALAGIEKNVSHDVVFAVLSNYLPFSNLRGLGRMDEELWLLGEDLFCTQWDWDWMSFSRCPDSSLVNAMDAEPLADPHGVAVGENGCMIETTPEGWAVLPPATTDALTAVAVNRGDFAAGGESGIIVRNIDEGVETFQLTDEPISAMIWTGTEGETPRLMVGTAGGEVYELLFSNDRGPLYQRASLPDPVLAFEAIPVDGSERLLVLTQSALYERVPTR